MVTILEEGLKLTDCTLCDKNIAEHKQGNGYSMLFLLSESHVSVHTWPLKNSFSVDFYNCGLNSWKNLKSMEEHLFKQFGQENATSSILLPRGRGRRILNMNDDESLVVSELRNVQREMKKPEDEAVCRQKNEKCQL
eukprot:TRINITY_DN5330_c0_g1_i1.p1 TRINITY_DN5330_c0_g1~~TRINITY_DN5330_c0_g1_i1.p1  ORF type:complete len:137 (-),score=3.25 TRINITY_DN5330_c0_g1_i1:170-580(-)